MKRTLCLFSCLVLVLAAAVAPPARGFTQSGLGTVFGDGVPMGHEWITRLAALEVIGGDPLTADPNDPRKSWGPRGRAKNTDVSSPGAQAELTRIRTSKTSENRYRSTYTFVLDAILGERWVDIGGFDVTKSHFINKYDCWDAVAQEAEEVQYDHFMRRWDDVGGSGGAMAATHSQKQFVDYFMDAAMAPPTTMRTWDGGGYSTHVDVDRNYFLFGRAVHLFQDSFSSEHTVRIADDNYERVRQVKAYLCSAGAEQHSHKAPTTADYSSGDVIWLPGTSLNHGWSSYKPSFMKPTALVATEASKDLWAAFIRTMGTPMAQRRDVAYAEAQALVANWLSYDWKEATTWYDDQSRRGDTYVLAEGQDGKGVTVATCMNSVDKKWKGDQKAAVDAFEEARRVCLYNIQPVAGYDDLWDLSLQLPYNWEWAHHTWHQPLENWRPTRRHADRGQRVHIKSVSNGQYLSAPDGLENRSKIRALSGQPPLDLILVGSPENGYYRATFAPTLFFSYNQTPGDAMLWNDTRASSFRLEPAGPGYAIYNSSWSDYMWLNGDTPRLNRKGDPAQPNAQWLIEGLK